LSAQLANRRNGRAIRKGSEPNGADIFVFISFPYLDASCQMRYLFVVHVHLFRRTLATELNNPIKAHILSHGNGQQFPNEIEFRPSIEEIDELRFWWEGEDNPTELRMNTDRNTLKLWWQELYQWSKAQGFNLQPVELV
jgi:hypothetical protein